MIVIFPPFAGILYDNFPLMNFAYKTNLLYNLERPFIHFNGKRLLMDKRPFMLISFPKRGVTI